MSATKPQFIAKLAAKSGLTLAQAESATNAIPETLGEWIREHGTNGPGSYSGVMDGGLQLNMNRAPTPAPHWNLEIKMTSDGLSDYGNADSRFGLVVENA